MAGSEIVVTVKSADIVRIPEKALRLMETEKPIHGVVFDFNENCLLIRDRRLFTHQTATRRRVWLNNNDLHCLNVKIGDTLSITYLETLNALRVTKGAKPNVKS